MKGESDSGLNAGKVVQHRKANPYPRTNQLLKKIFGDLYQLYEAMKIVGSINNIQASQVQTIYNLLPKEIKNAEAFQDQLTGIWRYKYGTPYDIKNTILIGTDQFPPVSILLKGLIFIHDNLPGNKQKEILKRLESKNTHLDHLSEFDPILRPKESFSIEYEPPSYGRNNRKIDWLFTFRDNTRCLIDVKNRIRSLLKFGEAIGSNKKIREELLKQVGSPEGIFRNSDIKFKASKDILQGLWVRTDIYYDEEPIKNEFDALEKELVHFVILTHFEGEARIFTRTKDQKNWLINKFSLIEMAKRNFLENKIQ